MHWSRKVLGSSGNFKFWTTIIPSSYRCFAGSVHALYVLELTAHRKTRCVEARDLPGEFHRVCRFKAVTAAVVCACHLCLVCT